MATGGIDIDDAYSFENPAYEEDDDTPDFAGPSIPDELRDSELSESKEQIKRQLVDEFYKEKGESPRIPNYDRFELDNKKLYLRDSKGGRIQVSKDRVTHGTKFKSINSGPLSLSRVRDLLELDQKLTQKSKEAMKKVTEIELTETTPKELLDTTNTFFRAFEEAETSFTEGGEFSLRELRGLDKSLRDIRGELTNNLAKLGTLDEHIKRENEKLAAADEDPRIDKGPIEARLKELNDERKARMEVLNISRERLIGQIQRIKDTFNKILHEDTTLGEKLRTLFKEQGITLASIITAIGFIISTIVLAVTGGPTGGPPAKPSGSGVKEWVKKQLHHISDLLKKLATKALESLPGIIGSVVSKILSTMGKAINWMADNLWSLILIAAGAVISNTKG